MDDRESGTIWGSDLLAETLRDLGIPYLCLNPGASLRGLHDSIVNHLGNRAPKLVVCLHEEHAVAMAHGYALVTGRPLAVGTHSNVGLMHASMAIYNAWCGRVPVLVLGATGHVDAGRRRPWIEWIHTAADQGALVRGFTKWDDQPASPTAAVESLRRGMMLACTAPAGPVYINFDQPVQEGRVERRPVEAVSRFRPSADPQPSDAVVAEAVAMVRAARAPVILSGRSDRSQAAWDRRVALAERLGAAVVTSVNDPAGFPSAHPLHAGETGPMLGPRLRDLLRGSDLVLSLDWVDPGGTLSQAWPDTSVAAKVIHASVDHHLHRGWSMDYQALPPVDLPVSSTSDAAAAALLRALEGHGPARRALAAPAMPSPPAAGDGQIGLADMASAVAATLSGTQATVVTRPIGWPLDANVWRHPLDFLGRDGGGGLGSGPGMTVGAALALRDIAAAGGPRRTAVGIVGDGDLLMGVNALWTAAAERIPLLLLVANNRSYFNDVIHQRRVAATRGRSQDTAFVGQMLADPLPDLAGLARAQGLEGYGPVRDPARLPEALADALARTAAGASVLLDVHVRPEYAG